MKNINTQYAEALDRLQEIVTEKGGVWSDFWPAFSLKESLKGRPDEVQLNIIEQAIKEVKAGGRSITEAGAAVVKNNSSVEDIDEAKRDYATLFGVEPRPQATIKEVARHIPKKNGDGRTTITETDKTMQRREKLVESLLSQFNGNENATRKYLGLKPKAAPEGLNRYQTVEYNFARKCGLSEADSLVLAKLPLKRR
jgi:hypothetical protein